MRNAIKIVSFFPLAFAALIALLGVLSYGWDTGPVVSVGEVTKAITFHRGRIYMSRQGGRMSLPAELGPSVDWFFSRVRPIGGTVENWLDDPPTFSFGGLKMLVSATLGPPGFPSSGLDPMEGRWYAGIPFMYPAGILAVLGWWSFRKLNRETSAAWVEGAFPMQRSE